MSSLATAGLFCLKWRIYVLYIFKQRRGPKRRKARENFPFPLNSDVQWTRVVLYSHYFRDWTRTRLELFSLGLRLGLKFSELVPIIPCTQNNVKVG